MKKLLSVALAAVMACSLMVPALATGAYRGPVPVTVYRFENCAQGNAVSRGQWVETPLKYDGTDAAGTITQEYTLRFNVEGTSNIEAAADVVKAAFGYTVGQSVQVTSRCEFYVPVGQRLKIQYRKTYQTYTADQVLYRIAVGGAQQELKREKVTLYVPYGLEYKGVNY